MSTNLPREHVPRLLGGPGGTSLRGCCVLKSDGGMALTVGGAAFVGSGPIGGGTGIAGVGFGGGPRRPYLPWDGFVRRHRVVI